MPALSPELTSFLTRIKDSLSIGPALNSSPVTARGAAANYLRAQDLATALELMQDVLQTVSLTAIAGSTATSVKDGAATFVAGRQIGNTVTFEGNVTAALAGKTAVVIDNDTDELFFGSALPAAPAVGDNYSISGTMFASAISSLREGKSGNGVSPAGSPYGDVTVSTDALIRALLQWGGSLADIEQNVANLEAAAGSTASVIKVTLPFRPDQFIGKRLTDAGGNSSIITSNSDSSITVAPALAGGAPVAGTAILITNPENSVNSAIKRLNPHPGGQPGENLKLAFLIGQVEARLIAVVLPT